ncbi:hypothetical protein [Ferrimonas balearica]|uniref:hypothetical protein n=1 Tax=Ferrimonas balearica TaxID=44012 RepID=UPI001C98E585|nr:hypothetical protein [Ferrimonas balearica]MBY5921602.1 hypothetical protein [Ferrimonas balearica]MBY5995058.1 hypothetical protein [Ferrimonas balearica]
MKLRFDFATSRPVPLYGRLCNQFLRHPQVQAIGRHPSGYFIEAEGDEAQLSALADLIGRTFPLSCWLTDSSLKPITEFEGEARDINDPPPLLPYCQHCLETPKTLCPHCGATPTLKDQPIEPLLDTLAETLLTQGEVEYRTGQNRITLRRLDTLRAEDDSLLFCAIESLNHALHISEQGIKQLGSIEKPSLRLTPRAEFAQQHQLPRARYRVQQAADRLTLALTAKLSQAGVIAVGIEQSQPPMLLTTYGDTLVALENNRPPAPLATHEPLRHEAELLGYRAQWQDGRVRLSRTEQQLQPDPDWAAACALEGVRQLDRAPKRSAVLYLSRQHRSGLLYQDSEGEYQWLVRLPDASEGPLNPTAMLDAIRAGSATGERLLNRYQEVDAAHLQALADLPQTDLNGSFHHLLAMAAWFSGVSQDPDPDLAGEAFLCLASRFTEQAAPRIDFAVDRIDGTLLVQWRRALQACLSYRLADPEQRAGVAFGVIDSFCDFVCNWVEQLDMNIGLEEVILAGDEFDNPVLLERLRLRLGKNMTLRLPADFGPTTLAIGALFVPQALTG